LAKARWAGSDITVMIVLIALSITGWISARIGGGDARRAGSPLEARSRWRSRTGSVIWSASL